MVKTKHELTNKITINVSNFQKFQFIIQLFSVRIRLNKAKSISLINSSSYNAAYMRQWTWPALVQITVCRLFGTKPLSEPILGLLSIGPLRTNFGDIVSKIQNFSFTKMHLKISSAKRQPFVHGGDDLINDSVQVSPIAVVTSSITYFLLMWMRDIFKHNKTIPLKAEGHSWYCNFEYRNLPYPPQQTGCSKFIPWSNVRIDFKCLNRIGMVVWKPISSTQTPTMVYTIQLYNWRFFYHSPIENCWMVSQSTK